MIPQRLINSFLLIVLFGWKQNMISGGDIDDRTLHWISAILLPLMLLNLSSQLHNLDWDIRGQVDHRQDIVEMYAALGVDLLVLC